MIIQLRLDLINISHEASHLTQFLEDGRWWCPRLEPLVEASHHSQRIGIHIVSLGKDTLVLSKVTGLVGKHHTNIQPKFVEMIGQSFVVDSCRLHQVT